MDTPEKGLVEIDGSYGEGGGQILRTALSLSAVLQKPLLVHHIRSKRKNPGLAQQHLTGAEALARITDAKMEGAKIGSERITFIPKEIRPGTYQFRIGTAGSVTLLLQAILLPLCLSQKSSSLTLTGGTHVSWSPPFHYLTEVLFPTLRAMGVIIESTIERWGWYPKGGGMVRVDIKPSQGLKPISLFDRGTLKRIHGLSAISHLPKHVAERQRDEALRRLWKEAKVEGEITLLDNVPANGPGSFLFLLVESDKAMAGFSSLGKKGKRAEEVAKEAVDSLKEYIVSDGCIDPHLADQIVAFMALAKGNSSFTTSQITEHLLTNLWVIQHFLGVRMATKGEKGKKGKIDFYNE